MSEVLLRQTEKKKTEEKEIKSAGEKTEFRTGWIFSWIFRMSKFLKVKVNKEWYTNVQGITKAHDIFVDQSSLCQSYKLVENTTGKGG